MTLRDFDAILNDPALIKAAKRRYARQGQEAAARLETHVLTVLADQADRTKME